MLSPADIEKLQNFVVQKMDKKIRSWKEDRDMKKLKVYTGAPGTAVGLARNKEIWSQYPQIVDEMLGSKEKQYLDDDQASLMCGEAGSTQKN